MLPSAQGALKRFVGQVAQAARNAGDDVQHAIAVDIRRSDRAFDFALQGAVPEQLSIGGAHAQDLSARRPGDDGQASVSGQIEGAGGGLATFDEATPVVRQRS